MRGDQPFDFDFPDLPAEVKVYGRWKLRLAREMQWRQALISLDFAGATAIELTMETPSSCSWWMSSFSPCGKAA